jgi:hypothetical protein
MSEESREVGQRTGDFENFNQRAKKSEDYLNDKRLNPSSQNTKKHWFGGAIAVGLLTGLGFLGARNFEKNVIDHDFGKPVENSQPFEVSFIHSTGENGTDNAPTFRTSPIDTSHELTEEELKDRGIDPTGNVRVMEVYGQTYASDGKGFIHNDQTRKNHGIWGEIVVTDPTTGQDKPTGIYLSENFISKVDTGTAESK